MKKTTLIITFCAALLLGALSPSATADAFGTAIGKAGSSAIGPPGASRAGLRGDAQLDHGEADSIPALMVGNTVYIPLDDFTLAMTPAVVTLGIDSMTVNAPGLYITAASGDDFLNANGKAVPAPAGIRMIGGKLHVPMDALAVAFGAELKWDGSINAVSLPMAFTPIEPVVPGYPYNTEEDFDWLSRIISIEARYEGMDGKIAVGNVVLNRARSPLFPNTVKEVVLDSAGGVRQFPPAHTDAIDREPDAASIDAAWRALEGAELVGAALYFNPKGANSWASRNRPYIATVGNHDFYG